MEIARPGISSWTKMRLNWIDQSKISVVNPDETEEILLGPIEDGFSEVLAIKIPLSDSTYYLIENRQPMGFLDRHLPGSGILIMFADDRIAKCRHGRAHVKLVNADPSVHHLEGGAFDLGKNETFIDEKRGLTIQLLKRIGSSYKIYISPYIKSEATAFQRQKR